MCVKPRSAATKPVRGRWILWAVLSLCCTTLVGALHLGPGSANWTAAVWAASPGSTIFFRPGVYHGCNVSIPSGLVERAPELAACCLASGRGCGTMRGRAGAADARGSGGAAVHRRCCPGHAARGAVVIRVPIWRPSGRRDACSDSRRSLRD